MHSRLKFMPICTALFLTAALFSQALSARDESTQQRVHHMSHEVMPFDMAKTVHIFRMTVFGGVQQVRVREPDDTDQVALIRQHLAHEAERFARGDFSDPMALHGAGMPGLAELASHADDIEVQYAELPDGAEITFRTKDIAALTAIHRWFGAQLSEHGSDARAE